MSSRLSLSHRSWTAASSEARRPPRPETRRIRASSVGLPQFGSFSIRAITSSADRTASQNVRALWSALVWVHVGPRNAAEGAEAILPAT